jgi:predicted MFS family arabinose efflux permease
MDMITTNPPIARAQPWSAVGSMALCVAMLIASEFMPVSLLTPIAADLRATEGMAGQAISVSGLFAVVTSLFIATIAGRLDRRHVLMGLTALMLGSLVLIAQAPNFAVLIAARAMVGAIQLSIMTGAAFGGFLLDNLSIAATLIGGGVLLVLASLTVGNGNRIKARMEVEEQTASQRPIRFESEGDFEACEQSE